MRTLGELLDGLVDPQELQAVREREVSGVFDDSRRVRPGGLFVAVCGTQVDGRKYIRDARERGASVIVGQGVEGDAEALVFDVPDGRAALAQIGSRWFGVNDVAADRFAVLGVTGTNGKSTTGFLTAAMVRAAGHGCGLLGTVQYDLGVRSVTANMTTPGALRLAEYLRECRDSGARAAVTEVSSHALDQQRVAGVRFAAAAFTNLSGDHLDYHGTFEKYREAKAKLFRMLDTSAVAVVNRDDANHVAMLSDCRARVTTYSLDGEADITARITRETVDGTCYILKVAGAELALENAIVGRHNIYNAMAAAGLAAAIGIPTDAIAAGIGSVRNVPGRLQRVPCTRGFDVFVDYAHTDDALSNVLSVLRPLTRRRLIVVFGCGGDRDRSKRPRMGRAVAETADAVIVTSDNPRSEDPRAIIDDILSGIDESHRPLTMVEPDRGGAIRGALTAATEGDVVLIAGKGHEDYQILGDRRIHFDDVEVAIEALGQLDAAVGAEQN